MIGLMDTDIDIDIDIDIDMEYWFDQIKQSYILKYKDDPFLKKIYIKIVYFLQFDPERAFCITYLCSSLGVSQRTFFRRLAERDKTYFKIKDEIRKAYAVHLLCVGGYRVDQVSKRLGFHSVSAFIQRFKRWNDCTPKQYLISN